ncbi:MAG: TIGR01212 family radical SAM protein [Campylobacterales bacterium]|nr:TIGR01212 family radical SAM protein [Campylobacterales bacterium]
MGKETLFTFGRYLRKKYHHKVAKIPIGLSGFTCPNIDGTVAKGGCTFCLNESFSPNMGTQYKITLNPNSTNNPLLEIQLNELDTQIREGAKEQRSKGAKKFLVYFQAFTNTYAPFDTLKILFEKALNYDDVIGLSIGTRSDSISDEVLDYLSELNKTKEIWIEYGVQSIHDQTLQRINRGHDALNAKKMIKKTKDKGLHVCAHLIYGLPGEDAKMMLQSTKEVYAWGVDSIKYHPLYVVKNTMLANEYKNGEFQPITIEEYSSILTQALKLKPKNISVQRIAAGSENGSVIVPFWCGWSKNKMTACIKKELAKEHLYF